MYDALTFMAANISDGSLRGLGVLVALLQGNGTPPTLVGIEEPEVALHPAAVSVLIDAIRDASQHTQVIVTSHSLELLDRRDAAGPDMRICDPACGTGGFFLAALDRR